MTRDTFSNRSATDFQNMPRLAGPGSHLGFVFYKNATPTALLVAPENLVAVQLADLWKLYESVSVNGHLHNNGRIRA